MINLCLIVDGKINFKKRNQVGLILYQSICENESHSQEWQEWLIMPNIILKLAIVLKSFFMAMTITFNLNFSCFFLIMSQTLSLVQIIL